MWDGCKILLGEKRTLKEMPQSSGKDPEDANTISQLPIVERLNVEPFLVTQYFGTRLATRNQAFLAAMTNTDVATNFITSKFPQLVEEWHRRATYWSSQTVNCVEKFDIVIKNIRS